ncbi:MAG: AraC family transcriptional regulator [Saprospiraceae bacterium]|nr:AraC family transcriptional regulator [Saprospiraceae bacterium]
MKASLEKIEPGFGSSFTLRRFTDIIYCKNPSWHFHPEYEIVYISNGRGKRHVGGHISYYEDGDLIFLGPNLPHFGFTEELYEEHVEYVVQLKEDFLGKDFLHKPEMQAIRQLFERSRNGLSFSAKTKKLIGQQLDLMYQQDNFERLLTLLSILQTMATVDDYKTLNANGLAFEVNGQDQQRMQRIYAFVEEHFQEHIPLETAAKQIQMTVPAFCRYFKKLTQKTFTQFVNEFRIAHACRMLSDEHLSIANISYESGFNNLSHFNKQFKAITGTSPREYRKNLKTVID